MKRKNKQWERRLKKYSRRTFLIFFFFLRIRPPPSSPLFPDTTLFRPAGASAGGADPWVRGRLGVWPLSGTAGRGGDDWPGRSPAKRREAMQNRQPRTRRPRQRPD